MSVPNLSNYIRTLNCSDKILLNELKSTIQLAIEYFSLMYMENTEDFESKTQSILDKGYEFFFKINTNLEFLHIMDESQTNKYKYEEAIQFMLGLNSFINSIQDLFYNYSIDMNKNIDLAKINSNNVILYSDYEDNFKMQKNMLTKTKINVFNNYLNQYVLMLSKINLIVKKITIY